MGWRGVAHRLSRWRPHGILVSPGWAGAAALLPAGVGVKGGGAEGFELGEQFA